LSRSRNHTATDIDIFAISAFDGVIGAFVEETTVPPRSQDRSRGGDATAVLYRRAWPSLSKIIGGVLRRASRIDGIKRPKKHGRRANYRESIEPLIAERARARVGSERASKSLTFASGEEFRSFVRSGPHPLCLSGRCASGRRYVLSFERRGPESFSSFFSPGRQVASTTRDIILVVGLWLPCVIWIRYCSRIGPRKALYVCLFKKKRKENTIRLAWLTLKDKILDSFK